MYSFMKVSICAPSAMTSPMEYTLVHLPAKAAKYVPMLCFNILTYKGAKVHLVMV